MAFDRGKYGIEYTIRRTEEPSSGFRWGVVAVVVVALGSLTWTFFGRFMAGDEERPPSLGAIAGAAAPTNSSVAAGMVELPVAAPVPTYGQEKYPAVVRNLLMRLEEATRSRDVEMAITTIERLRSLPGAPAASLDDALARRLGALNMRSLFDLRSPKWVKAVTIKLGDSASRIAAENGASLASLAKLNGGKVDKILVGSQLFVMANPRFNLVIHRRSRVADLALNGKFFKRYDLIRPIAIEDGVYVVSEKRRVLFPVANAAFAEGDRAELDMLLPGNASLTISEI